MIFARFTLWFILLVSSCLSLDANSPELQRHYEAYFATMPKVPIVIGKGDYELKTEILLDLSGYSLLIVTDACGQSFCSDYNNVYKITKSKEAEAGIIWEFAYPSISEQAKFGFIIQNYQERISLMGSKSSITQIETPYDLLSNYTALLPFQGTVGVLGASPDSRTSQPSLILHLYKEKAIPKPIIHMGPNTDNKLNIKLGQIDSHLFNGDLIYFSLPRRKSPFNQARTPFWGFSNARIQVESFDLGKLKYIALETKIENVYVPHKAIKGLMEVFNKPEFFPCEETALLPEFKIILGEDSIVLDASTFVKKHPGNKCSIVFKSSGEDPIVVLPIGFFSNNQVVLNYENNQIGVVFKKSANSLVIPAPPPLLENFSGRYPKLSVHYLPFSFMFLSLCYLMK